MAKKNVAVSIITPVYNAERYLADAIASVCAQTFIDWELIVFDDASQDGTLRVARRYADADNRIQIYGVATRGGAASARNSALQFAKGCLVAFLDADDRWHPQKLERQLAFMTANDAALSFTAYRRIDANGRELGVIGVPARVSYRELLARPWIGCSTAIFDRRHLGDRLMPDIPRRQDYAFWLSILREVPCAYGLNEVLADYRVHAKSLSSNKLIAALDTWKMYRSVEKLPLGVAVRSFATYATSSVIRRWAPKTAKRLGWLYEARIV